ncbi:unnamed protein product [Fusarium graminearum]|uniref:Uncharacterized protein n=1 Tax=Gibberella zeae TaxID=5518 RepID=A0A9N8RC28_GIBZA|nr:hypothetical protein FG05_30220 [Fusarium graminearum]CAF3463371.1 unnamed protein product [Fusarium graminearum]CAF3533666.1 unnamed protein product [Fusarium graminearum]CAG1982271.1 unnamed protein product [Fusarium graminearum]CAG2015068.1 unnamed protein product [Fusarium graminearum]
MKIYTQYFLSSAPSTLPLHFFSGGRGYCGVGMRFTKRSQPGDDSPCLDKHDSMIDCPVHPPIVLAMTLMIAFKIDNKCHG